MRKATFIMSVLSFVASVATLGVVLAGAKKVHDDVEEIRAKSNNMLDQFKKSITNLSF